MRREPYLDLREGGSWRWKWPTDRRMGSSRASVGRMLGKKSGLLPLTLNLVGGADPSPLVGSSVIDGLRLVEESMRVGSVPFLFFFNSFYDRNWVGEKSTFPRPVDTLFYFLFTQRRGGCFRRVILKNFLRHDPFLTF